jgi:hypothetical protein
MVCLSYLNASNPAQVRYAVRRLRRKLPRARILVGLWNGMADFERATSVKEASKADEFASTLREAAGICIAAARPDLEVLEDAHYAQRATENLGS